MKYYKLHLIRHGLTEGNLQGLYIGSGSDLPLWAGLMRVAEGDAACILLHFHHRAGHQRIGAWRIPAIATRGRSSSG